MGRKEYSTGEISPVRGRNSALNLFQSLKNRCSGQRLDRTAKFEYCFFSVGKRKEMTMSEKEDKILGNFVEMTEGRMKGRLSLSFQAMKLNIDELWEGSALSAKFLSTFWGKFFPDNCNISPHNRKRVEDEVHYISGELMGNAVKFSYEPEYLIEICLYLYENELRFYVINSLNPDDVVKFQTFIRRVLTEDPSELFLEQIEKSAAEENNESGIGFLTMINDYGVSLSWKFEEKTPGIKTVTTLARLPIIIEK